MALQDSGSGAFKQIKFRCRQSDISVELANNFNDPIDFGGAAASFSGILDDTKVEILEFYNKTFSGGTEAHGSRPTLLANYYGYGGGGGSFEIYTFTNSELIQAAENDISGFIGGNADALNKSIKYE